MAKEGDRFHKELSLGEVAKYCGVTRKTILRWVRDGMMESYTLPSGHHRVPSAAVVRFLRKHEMPVPAELAGTDKKRLLVAEDDDHLRQLVVKLFQPHFLVEEAVNGVEACLKIGAAPPDLLLLDIRMPKMDGLAVCRQIRRDEALAGVRIVVMSAYIDDAAKRALRDLSDAVVPKPFLPDRLLETCMAVAGVAGVTD